MKKALTVVVLMLLAGAAAYAYYTRGKQDGRASVTQAAITEGSISQVVQATGALGAQRNVQVGSQVSGVVKALYADFNSIVRKGQVLAELDPSLLEVQVEVQKANVERQRGEIVQQEVQVENDETNLRRARAQFDKGLISAQQLETAELQVKTRQAGVNSMKKQLVQSEANLHQAELNVSYCTIRSPVDGVVVDRKVDIGQTVQASMTTPQFFTISTDLTTLKLSALVDESDIGYIRRGMLVAFTVDAYGAQAFHGTVDAVRLDAQSANNVVTYPVWITVRNPELTLRPGMTANIRITVDEAVNVLKVPNQALRFRPTSDIYTWLGATPPATATRAPGAAQARPSEAAEPRGQSAASAARPAGRAAAAATAKPPEQVDDLFAEVEKRIQAGQVWIYDEGAADRAKRLTPVSVRVGLTDGQFSEIVWAAEELPVGATVVTGVVPPASALVKAASGTTNSVFNQQRGGGPGGFGGR